MKKEKNMISSDDWAVIYNPRVFDVEIYMKRKADKYRAEKEFFLNLEYEDVEAWAEFFNGLVADLKDKGKLK